MAVDLLLGTMELLAVDVPFDLPQRFGPFFAAGGVLTIWLDGCLALWPVASWSRVGERLLQAPIGSADARAVRRLVFGSAVEFAWGEPLRLPLEHRQVADLDRAAVLVGAGDHAELWTPGRWRDLSARRLDDFALPTAV